MKVFKEYINIVVVAFIVIVLLRIIESFFIIFKFGYTHDIFIFEIIGVLLDTIIIGFFVFLWYFIFKLFYNKWPKITNIVFLFGIIILNILHLTILKYYLYQLRPLDIFLYSHSLRESLFSYQTSNTNYVDVILTSIFISLVVIFLYRFIKKQEFSNIEAKRIKWVLILAFILFPFFEIFGVFNFNNFSINKSFYFYKRTIGYVLKKEKQKFATYNDIIFKNHQKTFNSKEYLSLEYPLLHKFENKDVIGEFINEKELSPNFVFVIVEGMSDEFIHNYKGLQLMPFMDSLSKNSLYWKNFFTVGERSFAVVPSMTGGLPYGERGFTMMNAFPYHFSLINILKKNGYYTVFFDSQDSWFHDKDKYFRFNNIDRVFDKNDFSPKYEKLLVGKENHFWGYNDKNLFKQSLEVIDTLPRNKRLEMFFTGTMHSPFEIDNEEKYTQLLDKKMENIKNQDSLDFFNTYKKQVLSLMFTDDAIMDYLESYKSKEEYNNTIFVITGDHPMTEIAPEDDVKKYHVPFIIYSPNLNTKKTFSGFSSHLDVYETILSYLSTNFKTVIPKVSTSLGNKLDTSSQINNDRIYTFMNDNREVVDIFNKGVFLSNLRSLYEVNDNFKLTKFRNKNTKKRLLNQLIDFNSTNSYVCDKNKLIPEEVYMDFFDYDIMYSYEDTICRTFNGKHKYIIENRPVLNYPIYIDISIDFEPEINEKTLLYYQFANKSGEVIYENHFNLSYKLQEHQKIPHLQSTEETLYLSVFLDNVAFKYIKYCRPNIRVYSYKP